MTGKRGTSHVFDLASLDTKSGGSEHSGACPTKPCITSPDCRRRQAPISGGTMQRLSLNQPVPEPFRGAVVALGNFDGFHLGHQAVVNRAVQRGSHERRPVIVATFDPHPVRLFKPDLPPFRLTTLDQRQRLFAAAGADAMLVFEFGDTL